MAKDHTEALEKTYAEEALDRKARATVQANNYNCSVKAAKFHLKKKPLIKKITCKNCGKVFKTNRHTNFCFKCGKLNL
jgi:Zn finger protein HypA/HybF involved in hydrogenase expression